MEIMAACLDKLVNENKFVYMDNFFSMIWWHIGGDKSAKGGFSLSIALVSALLSAKQSMVAMYIPGDARENSQNMIKCHQLMQYPKQQTWSALSKRPACASIMLYNVSTNGCLNSRFVKSCIVMINPTKQSQLNELVADNAIIVHNNDMQVENKHDDHSIIDLKSFDKTWSLSKSASKQFNSNWRQALQEMKVWENNYDRPSDLICISEVERKFHWDANSMCVFNTEYCLCYTVKFSLILV